MPNKYRLRSFDIEAMQWDGTQEGATPIIDWVLSHDGTARWHEERIIDTSLTINGKELLSPNRTPVPTYIAVDTRNPIGVARALQNGWIVWLAQGGEADWATSSPENFEEAFEPVPA